MASEWPGNVRQLRAAVERSLLGAQQEHDVAPAEEADRSLSFRTAKTRASSEWERRYLSELLIANGGNVSAAARAGRINRSHLTELLRRHGLGSLTSRGASAHDADKSDN
jgi:two-component system, NtrC family, response regulator GlrR